MILGLGLWILYISCNNAVVRYMQCTHSTHTEREEVFLSLLEYIYIYIYIFTLSRAGVDHNVIMEILGNKSCYFTSKMHQDIGKGVSES